MRAASVTEPVRPGLTSAKVVAANTTDAGMIMNTPLIAKTAPCSDIARAGPGIGSRNRWRTVSQDSTSGDPTVIPEGDPVLKRPRTEIRVNGAWCPGVVWDWEEHVDGWYAIVSTHLQIGETYTGRVPASDVRTV